MRLIDPNHPFFRPAWRRWATVLVTLAWAGMELWSGQTLWAAVFAAAAGYAFWHLILRGPDAES